MDYFKIFLDACAGFALFIYGMHVMASGLQKAAGNKMKKLLEVLTRTRLLGVLVGAGVTGIIQSSAATTVMVIGFVNAGLMNLSQSVGVIMGANIGTTVTAWLVSSMEWSKNINPGTIAPIIAMVGAVMVLFFKKDSIRHIGEVLVGLGLLFLGMTTMTQGLSPLADSPIIRDAFLTLGANPLLGLLAGAAVTALIQSSSASVGVLQSLAFSGLVPWNAAIYIIMGQNIGTCITAILSSIGTTRNAKSAAYIHLLFNIIGSVVFSIVGIVYFRLINPAFGIHLISGTQISIVHTMFNVVNTIILFPFAGILINMAQKMAMAGKAEPNEADVVHLDDRVLTTPAFAIENSVKETVRLGYLALENLQLATQSLFNFHEDKIEQVSKREDSIDALTHSITQYLVKICYGDLNEEENSVITSLFHTLNDIERVGDHAENIAELAQYSATENVTMSAVAIKELREIVDITVSCYMHCLNVLEHNDMASAKQTAEEEDRVDDLEALYRSRHIERLTNNECSAASSVVFLDSLTNLERVTDHALNIIYTKLNHRNKKKAPDGEA